MEAILIGLIIVGVLLMAAGFFFGRRRPGERTASDQGYVGESSDADRDSGGHDSADAGGGDGGGGSD